MSKSEELRRKAKEQIKRYTNDELINNLNLCEGEITRQKLKYDGASPELYHTRRLLIKELLRRINQ